MKNECEIVKDLLPSYIGHTLSPETNTFINEHLSKCQNCKKTLDNMQVQNKRGKDEYIEIAHLKKYNTRLMITKLFLFLILFIIIISTIIIFIKYSYNNNIMSKVIKNINGYKSSDNYTLNIREHRINYGENSNEDITITNYYYKDGKYKIESYAKNIDAEIINSNRYIYGEINSNKRTEIVENNKTVYNQTSNYNYVQKGEFFNVILSDIDVFNIDYGFLGNIYMRIGYQVRTDRFNGKEYYVFKRNDGKYFTEKWIDKESMMLVRTIQDYDKYYSEKNYSIKFDTLNDEDVTIPSLDGYNVQEENRIIDNYYINAFNNLDI